MAVHLEVEAARFADWRPARVAAPQAGVGRVAVAAARVRPDQQLPAVRLNNIFSTGYKSSQSKSKVSTFKCRRTFFFVYLQVWVS